MAAKLEFGKADFSHMSNSDKTKFATIVVLSILAIVAHIVINYKAVHNSKTQKEKNWMLATVIFSIVVIYVVSALARSMSTGFEPIE